MSPEGPLRGNATGRHADPSAPRWALLLSGSFGLGHDTLAEACANSLAARGLETRTFDSVGLMGRGAGAIGDWVFRRLLAIAPVYDAFHFSQLRTGGWLARSADHAALRYLYPNFVKEAAPVAASLELVLSVFATGAAAGARYKKDHPDVATMVFITDTVAHHMWVHEETDLFLVTSSAAAESVWRYRPRADVMIVTAPVRAGFYRPPPKQEARRRLDVPADARCVLLMSGGWGLGPIDEAATALAATGVHVLAVAGHNQALADRLSAAAARTAAAVANKSGSGGAIVPFGFTDRVPELMAAADLVVTSSGDTCREARAVGRPMVILDVVPGHGRENVMHEIELGHASVTSADATSVVAAVLAFFGRGGPTEVDPVGSADIWESEFGTALARVGIKPR
jgi:processive 1,2-diacylglycerol beta-glucosyltransferase